MWSSAAALLSWALACSTPQSPERAYLAALQASERCAAVPPGDLRGECVSMAARERAKAGDASAAKAACAQEALGVWQGECWFLVSDASQATGEEAEALCERAGPHRGQCLGHAAAREAKALLATPGRELEALRTLEARVARYRSGPRAQREAWELLAKARAGLAPEEPFSIDLCGELDAPRCAQVLQVRLGATLCDANSEAVAADAEALLSLAQAECPAP